MGVKLLQRRRRGMEPTAAGQTLLEHARGCWRQPSVLSGRWRATPRACAARCVCSRRRRRWPSTWLTISPLFSPCRRTRDIRVTMEERVSPDIVRGIREGSASLGVCWDAADLGDLASTGYRSDELAVAVHRSHPLAHRKRVRFVETLDYEQVVLPVNSAVNLLLGRAAAAAADACSIASWSPV